MHDSSVDFTRSGVQRGPAMYFGYCGRTRRYRMMDLPDYLTNVQDGMSRLITDASSMMQDATSRYGYAARAPGSGAGVESWRDCDCRPRHDCHDCHCDCCVCDADVLVHARCGETRVVPVTFENDTRREKPVKLTLGEFLTAGGRDVKWERKLTETEFTLEPCGEHTVSVIVQIRCDAFTTGASGSDSNATDRANRAAAAPRAVDLDRCEVAYASLRADGCLIRPIVIAVAVLPNDCDAYRRPCGDCCCH